MMLVGALIIMKRNDGERVDQCAHLQEPYDDESDEEGNQTWRESRRRKKTMRG